VGEFLHGNNLKRTEIRATTDNARKVVEAGTHLANGLALLIGTRFDDVSFDPAPLYLGDLSEHAPTPWRVSFSWRAHATRTDETEDDDVDSDDDLDSDTS